MTFYRILVRLVLMVKRKLNIIIIGANDGKIGDPLYDLIMKNAGRTDVLLVEPNAAIVPFLKENYSLHPSYYIANCAIGEEGMIQLFVIKDSWWERFKPTYAEGWPVYRAATGLTSGTRSNIEKALSKQGLDPKEAIDVINVQVKRLEQLCEELSWKTPIDILQIDAEGFDDSIIFSSNLEHIRPKVIYFETQNLTNTREEALAAYLEEEKYKVYDLGNNSLAFDSRIKPVCLYLVLEVIILTLMTAKRLWYKLKKQ